MTRGERAERICVWVRRGVDRLSLTCAPLQRSLQLQPHVHNYIHITGVQLTSVSISTGESVES